METRLVCEKQLHSRPKSIRHGGAQRPGSRLRQTDRPRNPDKKPDLNHMINGKTVTVTAPIFLLRSTAPCWRCPHKQEVVALAFKWAVDKNTPVNEQPREGTTLV